ncbi:MAG TPA: hypothetical protein VJL29_01015 [Thermoguttaceae bacterium]|nr:hypothetical protein [Thermoguttaceae bacterium]
MNSAFRILVFLSVVLASAYAAAESRVVLRQAQGDKTLAPRFYHVTPEALPAATAWFPTQGDSFELLPNGFRDRFGWSFVPPRPVVVYDYAEVPVALREALSLAVRTVAASELMGKPYDKTRVKKKEEYVKIPAPTIKNLGRTKRRRVLATEEEYRVQAVLDGEPEIAVAHMPFLKERNRQGRGLIMLVVDARLPTRGRAWYKVPKVLDVSTGYHAIMAIRAVAEVRVERTGDELRLATPEVLRLDVRLEKLELSNDLLDAARRQVRHFLNEEAKRKHDRIRAQANKAIAKAVDDQKFRVPMLRWLVPL